MIDRPMNDADPLLHDTAEDLYEFAPCGYLSTWPDGRIAKVNATLLKWLEYERGELLGRRFADLLTVGGRIHYETHFAPLLLTRGSIDSAALDLLDSHGERLPVFVTANTRMGPDGVPALIRITALDARERRSYERELIEERRRAEFERERVQVLATTLQRSLLPPSLTPPRESTPTRTTTSPRTTTSGEISTTCFRCRTIGGASSWEMCAARAPRLQPSPRRRGTPSVRRQCTTGIR